MQESSMIHYKHFPLMSINDRDKSIMACFSISFGHSCSIMTEIVVSCMIPTIIGHWSSTRREMQVPTWSQQLLVIDVRHNAWSLQVLVINVNQGERCNYQAWSHLSVIDVQWWQWCMYIACSPTIFGYWSQ